MIKKIKRSGGAQLLKYKNPIVIYSSGRLPLYLSGVEFINFFNNALAQRRHPAMSNHRNSPKKSGNTGRDNLDPRVITKALQDLNKKVAGLIIVYPVPEVHVDVPSEYISRLNDEKMNWHSINVETSLTVFKERTKASYEALNNVHAPNIIRVFPSDVFCDPIRDRCKTKDGGNLLYYDHHHLSHFGAKRLVEEISKKTMMANIVEID